MEAGFGVCWGVGGWRRLGGGPTGGTARGDRQGGWPTNGPLGTLISYLLVFSVLASGCRSSAAAPATRQWWGRSPGATFGSALAIWEGRLWVGAPGDSRAGPHAGALWSVPLPPPPGTLGHSHPIGEENTWDLLSPLPAAAWGSALVVVPDLDGDGHEELAVGAPGLGGLQLRGSAGLGEAWLIGPPEACSRMISETDSLSCSTEDGHWRLSWEELALALAGETCRGGQLFPERLPIETPFITNNPYQSSSHNPDRPTQGEPPCLPLPGPQEPTDPKLLLPNGQIVLGFPRAGEPTPGPGRSAGMVLWLDQPAHAPCQLSALPATTPPIRP